MHMIMPWPGHLRMYAPWGVRVVSLTKSRKIRTRNILPLFFREQARGSAACVSAAGSAAVRASAAQLQTAGARETPAASMTTSMLARAGTDADADAGARACDDNCNPHAHATAPLPCMRRYVIADFMIIVPAQMNGALQTRPVPTRARPSHALE